MKQISKYKCLLLGVFAVFLTLVAATFLYAPTTWANDSNSVQINR